MKNVTPKRHRRIINVAQPDRERLIAVKEAYGAMVQNLTRLCERVTAQYGA